MRFIDHGLQILELRQVFGQDRTAAGYRLELGLDLCSHLRQREDPLEGPRQCRAGRFVTGHQHCDQLIAYGAIRQRLAIFILDLQHEREDVVRFGRRSGTAARNFRVDRAIGLTTKVHHAAPRTVAAEVPLKRWGEKEWRPDAEIGEVGEKPDDAFVPRVAIDSEYRSQDDLKRDALRFALHRKRLTDRPRIDRAHRDLAHLVEVDLHPLAVKGRQQETPAAKVRILIHREHGGFAGYCAEDTAVGLTGMRRFRVRGEQCLEVVRRR